MPGERSDQRGQNAFQGKPEKGGVASVRESAMRLILEAYRILSDGEKRRAYDRSLRKQKIEQGGFNYRNFLRDQAA